MRDKQKAHSCKTKKKDKDSKYVHTLDTIQQHLLDKELQDRRAQRKKCIEL